MRVARRRSPLAIALALGLAAEATAQEPVLALDPTIAVATAGTIAADEGLRSQIGPRLRSLGPTTSASRPIPPARLAFRPDPAVRQRVYGRAVAQMRRIDAGDAAKLQQILSSGKLRREIGGYMARYGMSPDNLADTTALYLATAWLASRGSGADPSRAQMQGLRRQVAATYLATPEFARASEATKQELSEANLVQAGYAANLANAAAADRRIAPRVRDAVVSGVRATYGFVLLRLDLTDQGLR